MLHRVLESEVMDTAVEAVDYNRMDHSAVNQLFVNDFLVAMRKSSRSNESPWNIFDAGTGTALIPLELLNRGIDAIVTAGDLAEQMLVVARANVEAAGRSNSIRLEGPIARTLPIPTGRTMPSCPTVLCITFPNRWRCCASYGASSNRGDCYLFAT